MTWFHTIKSNHLKLGMVCIKMYLKEKEIRVSGDIGVELNEEMPSERSCLPMKKKLRYSDSNIDGRIFIFKTCYFHRLKLKCISLFFIAIQISSGIPIKYKNIYLKKFIKFTVESVFVKMYLLMCNFVVDTAFTCLRDFA